MTSIVPPHPARCARRPLPIGERCWSLWPGSRSARLAGMMAAASLDGLGVDRRAGAAGDHQRRAAEEELVDLVARAIFREFLEIEHLAHGEPHGGEPGLASPLQVTRRSSNPLYLLSSKKMWPSGSQLVAACTGMLMASSA